MLNLRILLKVPAVMWVCLVVAIIITFAVVGQRWWTEEATAGAPNKLPTNAIVYEDLGNGWVKYALSEDDCFLFYHRGNGQGKVAAIAQIRCQ